ncbi:MAG: diacylglycerol kinase [Candidatus Andersenbacteria bacterium]|nr:diacylglycerol kinase [Candidatus Andersenbacteria bacterium]
MTVFSFKKLARSFSHAIRGFKCVFREQNFKIQIVFSITVFILILLFDLKIWEIVVLIMMVTLVLVLEIINSIFERIMDILQPRVHPYAKTVKDMMASAVLVASLGAFLIGLLIFWPHFKSITQCF